MYRAYTSDKRSDPSHLQPFNPLRMLSVLKNISIRVIPEFRHRAVIATRLVYFTLPSPGPLSTLLFHWYGTLLYLFIRILYLKGAYSALLKLGCKMELCITFTLRTFSRI